MRPKILAIAGLLILTVLYAWAKSTGSDFYTNDQNFYMYASKLAAEGVLPYRDFFFSHPPLQIAISTILILIFGINFTVLNLLPALISILSALLIFLMCRTENNEENILFALLASAFFLFSCVQIGSALAYTGHNLALMFLLACTLAFLQQKNLLSGALAGLALLAGTHSAPWIAVLLFLCFSWKRSHLPHMLVGLTVVLVIGYGAGYAIAGWEFFEQTYVYHLTKPANEMFIDIKWNSLRMFFFSELHLIILATTGFATMAGRNLAKWKESELEPRTRLLFLSALTASACAIFIIFMNPLFLHYTLPIIACFSVAAAHGTMFTLNKLHRLPALSTIPLVVIAFAVALGVFFAGKALHQKNFIQLEFPHALPVANATADLIGDGETLYGDFGVVPTVALLTGKRIAANEVDSSAMRILSRQTTVEEIWERIDADSVGLFLTRENRGISSYPPFREVLEKRFFLAGRIGTPTGRGMVIEVWKRR